MLCVMDGGCSLAKTFSIVPLLEGCTPWSQRSHNRTFSGFVLKGQVPTKCIVKNVTKNQLVSELVGAYVARAMGLGVPATYLAHADFALASGTLKSEDGDYIYYAVELSQLPNAVAMIETLGQEQSQVLNLLVRTLMATGQVSDLFAFDEWVANTDRHPGNFLFAAPRQVILIDHDRALGGLEVPFEDLTANEKYENRMSEWFPQRVSTREKAMISSSISGSVGSISRVAVHDVLADLADAELLTDLEVTQLATFFDNRIPYLAEFISTAAQTLRAA